MSFFIDIDGKCRSRTISSSRSSQKFYSTLEKCEQHANTISQPVLPYSPFTQGGHPMRAEMQARSATPHDQWHPMGPLNPKLI